MRMANYVPTFYLSDQLLHRLPRLHFHIPAMAIHGAFVIMFRNSWKFRSRSPQQSRIIAMMLSAPPPHEHQPFVVIRLRINRPAENARPRHRLRLDWFFEIANLAIILCRIVATFKESSCDCHDGRIERKRAHFVELYMFSPFRGAELVEGRKH